MWWFSYHHPTPISRKFDKIKCDIFVTPTLDLDLHAIKFIVPIKVKATFLEFILETYYFLNKFKTSLYSKE